MSYDVEFWDSYSDSNHNHDAKKISNFIYNMCLGLNATKVLEVGCNVGNNLQAFPKAFTVEGVDKNEHAIEIACFRYPHLFSQGDIMKLSYPDNYCDVVFTRGLLIHIDPVDLHQAMRELLRVSKRWVFNLEYHSEDEQKVAYQVGLWKRNMRWQWLQHAVDVITEADIPETIDKDNVRFTLVRKK